GERLGLYLRVVDVPRLRHVGAGRLQLLRLMAREAILSHSVFYLDLDAVAPEERQAVLDDFASLGMFVIIAAEETRQRGRGVLTISVPGPDAASQVWLWRHTLNEGGGDVEDAIIGEIVEQFHFGPDAITRTVEAARQMAALR